MLREIYRTNIATKIMIDIFSLLKNTSINWHLYFKSCIKENVQCESKEKTHNDPVISLLCD